MTAVHEPVHHRELGTTDERERAELAAALARFPIVVITPTRTVGDDLDVRWLR